MTCCGDGVLFEICEINRCLQTQGFIELNWGWLSWASCIARSNILVVASTEGNWNRIRIVLCVVQLAAVVLRDLGSSGWRIYKGRHVYWWIDSWRLLSSSVRVIWRIDHIYSLRGFSSTWRIFVHLLPYSYCGHLRLLLKLLIREDLSELLYRRIECSLLVVIVD